MIFWVFQIRRLYLLLTVKESAIEVPTNLEARRRIAFFTNSLFMDMPRAPRVRKMLSFRYGVSLNCIEQWYPCLHILMSDTLDINYHFFWAV